MIACTVELSDGCGAICYTYNTSNLLTQVEQHDGTAYQITATMEYNGFGERIAVTSNNLVSTYTLDLVNGSRVLSATTAGLTTRYLYARGPLAEYAGGEWSYYLTDRGQVSDEDGEALFAVRYEVLTKWFRFLIDFSLPSLYT